MRSTLVLRLSISCLKEGGFELFEVEGLAVVGRETEFEDGGDVVGRGIAHVVVPAVLGIFLGQRCHIFVPPGLGKDARRGEKNRAFPE